MRRQKDAADTDAERFSHVLQRPVFEHIHVEIKDLKLLDVSQPFDPTDGAIHKVLFPFLVPMQFECGAGISYAFSENWFICDIEGYMFLNAAAAPIPAKLLQDARPSNMQEPVFERGNP
jgi:hypothetical protein